MHANNKGTDILLFHDSKTVCAYSEHKLYDKLDVPAQPPKHTGMYGNNTLRHLVGGSGGFSN